MTIILDGSTGIVSDSSASNPAMTAKGNGSDVEGYIQLNCRVNSHGVKLKSPPHSSGQSYTMVLPDNQVAADKFLKVKSITGSGANAVGQLEYATVSAGITEADQWRITSNVQAVSGTFNANWERTNTEFNKLGTGLSQSNGVFSFPSNGLYLLHFHTTAIGNGDRYLGVLLKVSTDNGSNYYTRSENYASVYNSGNNTWGNVSIDILLDVTDYSNFKFYFNYSASGTITYYGDTNNQWTGLYALRIGDT